MRRPLWIPAIAAVLATACADPSTPAPTPADSAIALIGPDTADLVPIATIAIDGGDLVRLRQVVDGIEVDGGELRVLVGAGGWLIATSGHVVPADIARDRSAPRIDAAGAVVRAVHEVYGVDVTPGLRARAATGGDAAWFDGEAAGIIVEEARARRRWFRDGDALIPAWIVEAFTSSDDATDGRADRTVIATRDGRVLAQRDLRVDAFTYRVWADPTGDLRPLDGPVADFTPHPTGAPGAGRPPFIAPVLVSIDEPWLAAGATESSGNNVDAYTDVNAPNGFSDGDVRASVTSPGSFDRVYDLGASPLASTAQQQAAVTQLFYDINWLHDDWYAAGFTEATGNGQVDNFGRGGVAGDPVLAEAQDDALGFGRNNANMATPDDGMSPRMQVYVWDGPGEATITVQPADRVAAARGAAYGPSTFDLTDNLVIGVDGTGVSVGDGCEPLSNGAAVAGQVALLERGNCTGNLKALNAQTAGAVGLIIHHNIAGSSAPGLPADSAVTTPITIPVMSVSFDEGAALRADLAGGPVQVAMHRIGGVDADGALDAGLIAHELGHYIHHRLSRCGTVMCGAMSEGWGDFIAMLMIARDGDDLTGTYAQIGYAWSGDLYFGLRRVPYSVDTTKNAFTFRMVSDEESLPTTHPLQFTGRNSEVHNAGEVWATALWEAYVALQDARGTASFDDTRRTMQRYVVNGLLLAPPDATFTETRDAILAAAQAASPADHDVLAAAFARRGFGSCAVSPPRDSGDFIGTIESFAVDGHAVPGTTTVATDVEDCDDDGVLDVGEIATVTVPVVNAGGEALSDVTVSLDTHTPFLTVLTEPVVLGALAPYTSASATFQVSLADASSPVEGILEVTIASPGGCEETQLIELPLRLAADDELESSASDSFDASASPWTPAGDDGDVAWTHGTTTALDGHWHGTDLGTTSDTMLESPPLIAGSGALTIAFDHVFQFEFSDFYYDGGVIEISTDAGATWADVSTLTEVPYNAIIGGDTGNALEGQMAFGDRNPSFPDTDRVSLDLGTQLAGETFQLRFRIATDVGLGAPGWTIDNLGVTGITNTPFPVLGPDDGVCDDPEVPDEDGGCCSTGDSRGTAIAAGLLVAALLVRRRRRSLRSRSPQVVTATRYTRRR